MALSMTVLRIGPNVVGFRATSVLSAAKLGSFNSRRNLTSKQFREPVKKPKPFPYEKYSYNWLVQLLDKTTLRFDENTKLIVVEGAHGIGKTKLAREIAEQLDFKFIPNLTMDFIFKTPTGEDWRQFNNILPARSIPFDETDFIRNPTGTVPGSADRFFFRNYYIKYVNYVNALRHIFSTGEGVVMEQNPFSDYIHFNAAFNQGWIDHSTKKEYDWLRAYKNKMILRPNLIIYLDADVDVVQKKIAARNNEWDKDSPVWKNTNYLNDIYRNMKQKYLKDAMKHSLVLVYDWNEEGETDIVVEDIERLNFDWYETHEDQQHDWRFHHEDVCEEYRRLYCNYSMLARLLDFNQSGNFGCKHLMKSPHENEIESQIFLEFDGAHYAKGFDPRKGDKNVWLKFNGGDEFIQVCQFNQFVEPDYFRTIKPNASET